MYAKLLWYRGAKMKTALQRSDCPTYSLGRECEDRDFQQIPRLLGNQNGVYLRWKSPQSPAKAQMGACGGFKWLVH